MPPTAADRSGLRAALLALLAFLGLTVLHTWPLAAGLGTHSRVDTADYLLNAWAVHWIATVIPWEITRVFHAGIFHPEPYTLAYSDPLLLQGLVAVPVVKAGGSAVLAVNVALLAGLTLTGWAFYLYVQRATGSHPAGLVAGCLAAYNAHHLVRLTHVQALHLELVPLAVLALEAVVARPTLGSGLRLGAAVAAQALASLYLLVFTAVAIVSGALATVWSAGIRRAHAAGALAAAAMAAGAFAAPVLWPYWAVKQRHGLVRDVGEAVGCSSTWTDYLYTGATLHFEAWSSYFQSSADANFPGIAALALALAGVCSWRRDRRTRLWLGILVGSVLTSVAPRLPGFAALHESLPVLGVIRCYSRAGQMGLLAIAVLAGFGLARLLARCSTARRRAAVGVVSVVLVTAEALRAPIAWVPAPAIPALYEQLGGRPGAVVHLPFPRRAGFFLNAGYMLPATRHGRPLLNGYSGFAPPDYDAVALVLRGFPDEASLALLRARGVTDVVVHTDRMRGSDLERIERSPALRFVVAEPRLAIYRLE